MVILISLQMKMTNAQLVELSQQLRHSALRVLDALDMEGKCRRMGVAVHVVGSLKTGLLLNHRDIDLHLYTDEPMIGKSFAFIQTIAENKGVKDIQYKNLLDTKEECMEWHLWYEDEEGMTWKLDLIHIRKGSFYDGFFENVTDRIARRLSPQTKEAILRIKYELGEKSNVPGIRIYYAVLEHGITDYAGFTAWSKQNPVEAVLEWIP